MRFSPNEPTFSYRAEPDRLLRLIVFGAMLFAIVALIVVLS